MALGESMGRKTSFGSKEETELHSEEDDVPTVTILTRSIESKDAKPVLTVPQSSSAMLRAVMSSNPQFFAPSDPLKDTEKVTSLRKLKSPKAKFDSHPSLGTPPQQASGLKNEDNLLLDMRIFNNDEMLDQEDFVSKNYNAIPNSNEIILSELSLGKK